MAAAVLIVGDQELADGTAILRNMADRQQISVAIDAGAIRQALEAAGTIKFQ